MKRFDPLYWTVDFPRPMMASAVTTGPHSLRVEALFYRRNDLAGLIWEAEDRHDHPLLRYETSRDFRRCRLAFRWRSEGLIPLDAVHGPTLTIEGRDEAGAARSWYVRLWNYAEGAPEDAEVTLDFSAVAGGWAGEDPVWAGDIDRMFVSLVAPGYSGADLPLDGPAEGWAELSGIACDGSGSVLEIGDGIAPEHELRVATAYDDLYHLTPGRLLRGALLLGFRALLNHYVGMSHYFRLGADGKVAGVLNGPCAAWHRDFLERAEALGFEAILSLSFELLAGHCPESWKQRAEDGTPALTGWEPTSALLSPANAEAMAYLEAVALAFAAIADGAGQRVRIQIGEPWWWVMADGRICLYDAAAVAAFAPVPIANLRSPLNEMQEATLDAAGAVLAAATAMLASSVKAQHSGAETLLLAYLPAILDPEMPDARRANLPLGWASPAFDVLQLEDYEWVTGGRCALSTQARAIVDGRLGYVTAQQHYLAGFVLQTADRAQWAAIAAAGEAALRRGTAEVFVWALPQVLRDGFTYFGGEASVDAFDDVLFPVAVGREASVEPCFSTDIATTAAGVEQRNSAWADARLRFDIGPGLRSETDLQGLLAFFRARRGAAVGFRFQDPFDHSSNGMTGIPGCADQPLGIGDGARTGFRLAKHYGGQQRWITRPRAGTVRVAVGGVEQVGGWTLGEKGAILFDDPPAAGAALAAGFLFDVPVRFQEDRLSVSLATFRAGEALSAPLIEIREQGA
ncbi:MAG: hypothetical protein QOC65_420 [Sphingomonadales bacterium]|nr:hypothetical protein [Sphingomonadales bacterium]